MPKTYLWDWSLVPEAGPRFENLVAGHLLKYCHFLQDREGYDSLGSIRSSWVEQSAVESCLE